MGAEIKKMYTSKGLTPPEGKGEHTKQFHKMATGIMAGNPDMPKSSAYAITMSKLGRDASVNPSHRRAGYKRYLEG